MNRLNKLSLQRPSSNKFHWAWSTFKQIVLFATFVLASPITASSAQDTPPSQNQIHLKVKKFQLNNGLTVLLHEDHSSPVVSVQQAFRVGSKHESVGKTGLAHFFEHLMFKGTKKYPREKLARIIREDGGNHNAYTTHDYTNYYVTISNDILPLILDAKADQMRNLLFKEEQIKSERNVVKEERRYRIASNVLGSLFTTLFETIYTKHPYKEPVLGSMKDLNNASIKDLKSFYNTFYVPNNAVLVVAGNFKSYRVKKLINKYYGPLQRQDLPKRNLIKEPEQKTPRKVVLRKDVKKTRFVYAYPGIQAGSDDSFALDLLTSILSDGDSSRLHQNLVYKSHLATKVSSGSYTLQDNGFIYFLVEMNPLANVKKAEAILKKEIHRIKNSLVSERVLQKAKNQLIYQYITSLKTISGKAQTLALFETFYKDYSIGFKDIDRYLKVTSKDILNVAKKYFKPKKVSIIKIVPKKHPTPTSRVSQLATSIKEKNSRQKKDSR